jgi:hypothetical protein
MPVRARVVYYLIEVTMTKRILMIAMPLQVGLSAVLL